MEQYNYDEAKACKFIVPLGVSLGQRADYRFRLESRDSRRLCKISHPFRPTRVTLNLEGST